MSSQNKQVELWVLVSMVLLFLMGVVACMGPAGLKTQMSGWSASAYGSDWLVVQYAQSGCVISSWELKDEAIQNETSSDGIFFVSEDGSVVHLSGHYVYVQSPGVKTEEALRGLGPCVGD